jgi:hypothetical protein
MLLLENTVTDGYKKREVINEKLGGQLHSWNLSTQNIRMSFEATH